MILIFTALNSIVPKVGLHTESKLDFIEQKSSSIRKTRKILYLFCKAQKMYEMVIFILKFGEFEFPRTFWQF